MTSKVAVDMDSTLAATWEMAFELLEGPDHDKSYDDLEYWDWGVDEYGHPRFLNALWGAWTIRGDDIRPMESGVANVVQSLHGEYEVHIVTTHPDREGINESKQDWLDSQGIPYDDFVPVPMGESKGQYGYGYYIDDKPGFAERVPDGSMLYLRDQRYNRHIETEDYENVERVRTVAEAVNRIKQ
jgi:5'(3')-deoxyribonucleotidase